MINYYNKCGVIKLFSFGFQWKHSSARPYFTERNGYEIFYSIPLTNYRIRFFREKRSKCLKER